MKSRAALLRELIDGNQPAESIAKELAAFPWDSEEELVVLTPSHVGAMLKRFINGESSCEEVRAWAETIEGREDVGFQLDCARILKQAIYELANPEITRPLTTLLAQKILSGLRQ